MKTYRIEIYGRVQGVFFRKHIKDYADFHHLLGHVKNQTDGSVLILVQCEMEQLRNFLSWIQSNPGVSKIERAEIEEINFKDKFEDFEILKGENFFRDKKEAVKNLGKNIFREL